MRQRLALGTITILGVIGAAIGGLMTWHHDVQLFGDASVQTGLIGCESSAQVNCDIVNTSEYAELLQVPIATWGIATYILVAGLAGMALRRRDKTPIGLEKILLGIGTGTVLYSAFLFGVSKIYLQYVCAWCLRLYGINFAIFGLAWVAGGWRAPRPSRNTMGGVLGTFVLLSLVSIGGERLYRGSLLGDAATVLANADALQERTNGTTQTENASEIFLDPEGPAPRHSIAVTTEDKNEAILEVREDDAWKGNPEAEVVLVEFADLECGYCKRASSQLHRLYEAYGDRVLFVFKHFPMDPQCNEGVRNRRHRYACQAARASVCAQQQGRFWAFHDLAFKNQHKLKDENLRTYAEVVGADLTDFDACMTSPVSLETVRGDGLDGKAVEAHGTPRIFINGRLYRSGTSAEQMAMALELALGTTAQEARTTAQSLAEDQGPIMEIPDDVPDMQHLSHDGLDFWMDTFEAGLDSTTIPGTAQATVGKHQIPATRMSWFAARDACEAAGKRLCTEEEWIAACQGQAPVDDDGNGAFADDMVEGNSYPYSDFHTRGRCWDGHERGSTCDDEPCRPVYTGEMPGCVSGDGIYDLTGNVEEWVGSTPETAVLLGGAFDTSKDHARCYRRNDTYGAGYANVRTGFRCCRTGE